MSFGIFYCFLKFQKRPRSRTVDRSIVSTIPLACSDVIEDCALERHKPERDVTELKDWKNSESLINNIFEKLFFCSFFSSASTVHTWFGNSQPVVPLCRGKCFELLPLAYGPSTSGQQFDCSQTTYEITVYCFAPSPRYDQHNFTFHFNMIVIKIVFKQEVISLQIDNINIKVYLIKT
jgi:hypothetical protein